MGIEKQPRNIRFDAETDRKISEIQQAFHPWCANRSDTVRKSIDLFHAVLFTPGILERVIPLLQGTKCAYFVRTPLMLTDARKEQSNGYEADGTTRYR